MKKVFLLFGASGELGKKAVEYFLGKEYDYYYFFSRQKIKLDSADNKFELISINDISDERDVKSAFSKIKAEPDSAYFLYSTIGGFFGATVDDTSYSDWQNMLNINLNSAFLISKYFARLVKGTQGGSICFTSAYSSLKPSEGKIAYNLSKNGLNYFVESFALEAKKNGLSINAVAPFAIDTPSNREWIKDVTQLVTPNQICEVVEFLFLNYEKVTGNVVRLP